MYDNYQIVVIMQETMNLECPIYDPGQSGGNEAMRMQETVDLVCPICDLGQSGRNEARTM